MFSILIIDDERWVRSALKWTIKQLNLPFQIVKECENGLEALDWVKQNEIELIFTDVRMPVMDGLTFVKELQKIKGNQDVVVISVHDEFQYVQEALRSGVTDYLLKPIEENELRDCLEKWLDKRKEEASNVILAEDEKTTTSTIEQVLQYIKKTPLAQVTLKDAAESVHLNPSYLSQLFKQQLNKKFVDYITELRIEKAKWLLEHTSLRISEVSERVGYGDLAYFSNNFKRITGSTPSEFRKSVPQKEK